MKKIMIWCALVGMIYGCTFGEKDEFFCEKNAVVERGDTKHCAHAKIDYYRTNGINGEQVGMGIGWSTGGLSLALTTDEPITKKTYDRNSGASFWFNELNRMDAVSITIAELDTVSGKFSGYFSVEGEGNSNFQAYTYRASGNFNDLVLQ